MKKIILILMAFLNLKMHCMEEEKINTEEYSAKDIVTVLQDETDIKIKGIQTMISHYSGYLRYANLELYVHNRGTCKVAFSKKNKLMALMCYLPNEKVFYISIYDVNLFKLKFTIRVDDVLDYGVDTKIAFTPDYNILLFSNLSHECLLVDISNLANFFGQYKLIVFDISNFRDKIFINENIDEFYSSDKKFLAKLEDHVQLSIFEFCNKRVQIYKIGSSFKHKDIFARNNHSRCVIL